MPKESVGLLMYRRRGSAEVLLVHPGGPYWARRDLGSWSIPKGEPAADEDPLAAARREFQEETGFEAQGHFRALGSARQSGGKIVTAWAFESDCDPAQVTSNTFSMEWPPKSGRRREFPEVDRAAWFDLETAQARIVKGQIPLLEELQRLLAQT